MSKLAQSRPLFLATSFALALGLGFSVVAEADSSHLPSLPVIEADINDGLWVCDLSTLWVYLVDEGVAGAYYEADNVLYHVDFSEDLYLGFEERSSTNVYVVPPSGFDLGALVDGGAGSVSEGYNFMLNKSFYRVFDDLSTYEIAAVPLNKAPSLGKIRIQSHDRCPPPKDGGS